MPSGKKKKKREKMIVTCVDNDLAELSSLEDLCLISRRSSWLDEVVDEIQSCTSDLRFLRMFFWSVLTLDDTADDDPLITEVNNTCEVYWGKSRKVAPFPLVSTRIEYDGWIRDLQRRIQDSKQKLEESCEHLLLHRSLRCNSLEKKNTGKFLDAILENLKDLYKCKGYDETVLVKKQIGILEKKLTLLHHLFELTPKEWRSFEEMREFKVVVHAFAHYSASLVFMYWVKGIDEGTTKKLEVLLFVVLHKYKPCVPVLKAFYGRFLKEMKSSQFDPLLLGRIIQVFLDLLLGDFQLLQESLLFVIAFLASPPDQYSDYKELMTITTKIEVLVEVDLCLVLSVDETKENLSEANKRLKEFMRKVEQVKGHIRIFYDRIRDSFSYDFPKTNGLGFFDFLLQNLGFLKEKLKKDTDFIPFAKHLIIQIEEELMSMRPYLDDLFELQKEHKELKDTWLKVTDLAYRSEYAINSCMVTGNALWYNVAGLMEVLDNLKDVNSNLRKIELIQGRKTHDGAILRSSIRVPEGPSASSFKEEMVGLKEEAAKIVENLINGSKSLDIVAIVGMAGIGKTTMAKKVYTARAVQKQFTVFAYCTVSQVHNTERVLLDILGVIKRKDDMLEGDLATMIRLRLKGKKYLIVMDDIWDVKTWVEVKKSLPDDKNGSRVIFTTRIQNVALLASEKCIHHLRPLSDKESWDLFQKKAFPGEGCPPDFLEVGKMIAKNCKGFPLAIVSIAGRLARSEGSLSWWNNISEAVSSYVLTEDGRSVLESSYQHLPEHLKPCFLYFGVFAKDTIVRVGRLTLSWIAEGFVRNSEGRNLNRVAKEYLCDLVGRSLVIACVRSSNGGIKSCQIHDLVHAFCQVKAQEENFFQFIDGDEGSSSSSSTIRNPYRVCVHMKGKYPKEAPKICPNIHSLLSTAVHDAGNLKLVQVMDLKDLTRWSNLKPVHLRFLAGPTIPGARIPCSISNLWNLQFLILTGTSVLELPETFWNMTKLIHVDVGQCHLSTSRAKKGEAYPQMVNLESFSSPTVYSTKDLEEVLQRSPSLIKLSFHYEYEEELEKISHTLTYSEPQKDIHFPNLDSSKLESLKVSTSKELRLHPFEFPSTLKKLTLSGGNLRWGYLQAISEMPCLEVLKLLNNAFAGPKWDMEDTEFPKLKFLKLDGLELAEWIAYVESFPSLEVLTVSRCNHLDTIPRCFEEMATLKRIEVLGSRTAAIEVVETHETTEQIPLEEMTPLKRVEVLGSRKAAVEVVATHETAEQIPLEEMAPLKRIEGFGSRKAAVEVVATHETAEQTPLEEIAPLERIEGFGSSKAATEVVEIHETAEQIPLEEEMAPLKMIGVLVSHKATTEIVETPETAKQTPLEEEMAPLKMIGVLVSHKDTTEIVETPETAKQTPLEEKAPLNRIEGFGLRKAATKLRETAEQIPLAVVGFVLGNLIDFILYNFKLIGGLDDNIKKVVDDLDLLKALAKEYSKIDTDSNAVLQKLANDVRDLVYQAEDAIEDYIICQTLRENRGVGYRALGLFSHASDLRQLGKRIQDVSANVTLLIKERAPTATATATAYKGEKKKKVLAVEEDNVIGFEDEAAAVIELLMGGAEDLEIISIIGMLGLGKTTLAKKVLKDPNVEYNFFHRAFVNVSREYERREVFINILRTFKCTTTPDMNDDELAEKLRAELYTTRYLIVMDDVWSPSAWDDLKDAFPNNYKGSRVLITSRDMRVATHANPPTNLYNLRFRTSVESRELLRKKVFRENEFPDHLLDYVSQILKKCDGLPLAIVVVAGILLNLHERVDGWKKVAENVADYVAQIESQLRDRIKVSFQYLPYHLKACFLYLGVFGENSEIPLWKLLRLWIAEGFIQKNGDMSLENVAEDYLEDLVDRSLVMVGRRRSNGQIKTCRIHDTLRDFCKTEASKQNLFKEIKKYDQSTTALGGHPSYRRICVNSNVSDYITSKLSGAQVRSFLTFAKEETTVPLDFTSSIPKAFVRLRVLNVKSLKFTRFPLEIMELVLLKYISMSIDFKMIPQSFSDLIYLQTIDIDTTEGALEIKADISKLALLRHLQTNASASLVEGSTAVVNPNLQTLCSISPESCTMELFERYPKLKKLGIRGKLAIIILDSGEFSFFETLTKLEFLENLKLINDDTSRLHVLPHETSFPRNLRMLTLMNTFLDWSQISTVGKLQNLEVLKLKDNAFDGEKWNTEDGGFRCLKVLHIVNTQKLVLWEADASHFPKLTTLYLRHCANLEAIPHIPSLHTIDLYWCIKPSVAASAQKIQDKKASQFKLTVYPPYKLELRPTASFSGPAL